MYLSDLSELIRLLQSPSTPESVKRGYVKRYCEGSLLYAWCKLLLPAESGRCAHFKKGRLIAILNECLGINLPKSANLVRFQHPNPAPVCSIKLEDLDRSLDVLDTETSLKAQKRILKPIFEQATREDMETLIKVLLRELAVGGPKIILDGIYPGASKDFKRTGDLKQVVEQSVDLENPHPILPALASECNDAANVVFERSSTLIVDEYHVGERIQIHFTPQKIVYYTKQGDKIVQIKIDDMDSVVRRGVRNFNGYLIFDAQLVRYDNNGLLITNWKRAKNATNYIYAFDCLYWHGFLLNEPLLKRHAILGALIVEQRQFKVSNVSIVPFDKIEERLPSDRWQILKDAYGKYEPARRIWYIVRKKTIARLIVCGCWGGTGQNAGTCIAFQVGYFEKGEIRPLAKVSSGVTTKMMCEMATSYRWNAPDEDGLCKAVDLSKMPIWKVGGYLKHINYDEYTMTMPHFLGVMENGREKDAETLRQIQFLYGVS